MKLRAIWILLKGMRAESFVLGGLWLTLIAVTSWAWIALTSGGMTTACMTSWLVAPFSDPACQATVEGWSDVVSNLGSRVLSAAGPFSLASGLVLGVGLVASELESGTAELTWSLALDRRRWFFADFLRRLAIVVLSLSVLALVLWGMEAVRTAGGLWLSPWPDAELYGLPVIARGCLGLAVGAFFGSLVGRQLPALLCGAVVVIALTFVTGTAQDGFVHVPDAQPGAAGYVAAYLANDDVEIRFVTPDNQLLTRAEALASVPAGVADPAAWLQANEPLMPFGITEARTRAWQVLVSMLYLLAATGFTIGASAITSKRRPTL
jgi:hypothetical protein